MTEGLEYLGRARFQGLTLLAVAFLVGVLAGFAGDRMFMMREDRWPPPHRGGPHGPPPHHGLPEILDRLDLTARQRTRIDSLLEAGRPRADAVMRQMMPRLRAVSDSLNRSIREVLNPEQRVSFDRYLESRRRFGGGPPPHGGPPGRGEWMGEPPPPPPPGDEGGRPPGGP